MKQHITAEQLNELSEKGKKIMKSWLEEKNYFVVKILEKPFYEINIGIMIEFLGKFYQINSNNTEWRVSKIGLDSKLYARKELCDALWEAVKEVLNS